MMSEKSGPTGVEPGCQGIGSLLDDAQWAHLQRRYDLTPRERQIAELICQGLRNDSIATKLAVRPETVKTHVRNVYRKTGVRSKVLLLLRFFEEAGGVSGFR